MTTYISVAPGINMSKALGSQRLTKKWLTTILAAYPHWDFRILNRNIGGGTYVNGEDCIRIGLVLEVRNPKTLDLVASVEFKGEPVPGKYKAVFR